MRIPYRFLLSCFCLILLTACGFDAKPISMREAVVIPGTGGIKTSLSTNSNKNTAILVNYSLVVAGPSSNSSTLFLHELEGLISLRRNKLLASPGWVKRLVRLTIAQEGEQKIVENETSIQFDENGLVVQVIEPQARVNCSCQGGVLMSWARARSSRAIWDMQPQDIWTALGGSQLGLYDSPQTKSGIEKEILTGAETIDFNRNTIQGLEPGQPLLLDFGFLTYAQNRVAEGARLHRQTIYENCWYLGEQYNLVDRNQRVEALFNPDTGKLRRLQFFDISQKDIRLLWRIDLAVEE